MTIMENKLRDLKIIVVGTIFLDIKGYADGDFKTASRNIGRIEYVHGGVGRNVAEDLAALGCRPVFISMSEDNPFGRDIVKRLNDAGVNTDYIMNVPEGIGTWMAIFNNDNDVYASISKRQDLRPLISVLEEKGDEIFSGCQGLMLEMDVDENLVRKVFELAEKYRVDVYGVISNMDIAKQRLEYIRKTRCFICNRYEAGILFDCHFPADDPAAVLKTLKEQMRRLSISCMIVTLDKDGSVYAVNRSSFEPDDINKKTSGLCPAEKVEIADSTGAGDAFFTGTCAGLISGSDIMTACQLGTRMASEVISTTENVYRTSETAL